MWAALASRSTVSQPDSTTGENAIRSTFWAMKERIALTWFSCFCCASANFRLTPAFFAASLIETVLAVRHSLSAPTCEKPIVSGFSASAEDIAPQPSPKDMAAPKSVLRFIFMLVSVMFMVTLLLFAHCQNAFFGRGCGAICDFARRLHAGNCRTILGEQEISIQ